MWLKIIACQFDIIAALVGERKCSAHWVEDKSHQQRSGKPETPECTSESTDITDDVPVVAAAAPEGKTRFCFFSQVYLPSE